MSIYTQEKLLVNMDMLIENCKVIKTNVDTHRIQPKRCYNTVVKNFPLDCFGPTKLLEQQPYIVCKKHPICKSSHRQ